MHRSRVCGVGINDVYMDGMLVSQTHQYQTWVSMLGRCYSAAYLAENPTYQGCSVDHEWLRFSRFKQWMDSKRWEGLALDKDLKIPGNKIYSSNACLFIPQWVNSLLSSLSPQKRALPTGVNMNKGRFAAKYKSFGKTIHIGLFGNAEDAHIAYRVHRLWEIKTRVNIYCDSAGADQDVCAALLRLYENEACKVRQYPPVVMRRRNSHERNCPCSA